MATTPVRSGPQDGTADGELLSVKNLKMYFPITQGIILQRQVGWVRAVDDISSPSNAARRSAWSASRAAARAPRAAPSCSSTSRPPARSTSSARDLTKLERRRAAQDAPRDADDLPGSVRQPEPAHDGRQHHRRAAGDPQPGARAREAGARPGAAADRRPEPVLRQPLPARVLGRPAPAHRHRPRAGGAAELHRVRRADLGARRVDPGAGHQPARGAAGAVQPDLPVHRPRPVGGAPHLATAWR